MYGVFNELNEPISAEIDCRESEQMSVSTASPLIRKTIMPGGLEFFMHSQALPDAESFVRAAKLSWEPLNK
jgi:hypothetical protein